MLGIIFYGGWGCWPPYIQGGQAEECPHHLLVNLLQHKDFYMTCVHILRAYALPHISTKEDMLLRDHRHNQASVHQCRDSVQWHMHIPVSTCRISAPVLFGKVGSHADLLAASFLCT